MMNGDKSYVTMERKLCPVCRKEHDVGVILDRRLRDRLPRAGIVTGIELCPIHKAQADEHEAVWLCEADPAQSNDEEVYFLPGIARVSVNAIRDMFTGPIVEYAMRLQFALISPEGFKSLTAVQGAQHVNIGTFGLQDDDDDA